MVSIAITGHRPNNKSMGGYDYNSSKNLAIKKEIRHKFIELISSINDDFTFYCGGALGVDTFCFQIVEDIKNKKEQKLIISDYTFVDREINLILAMPFKEQDKAWFKQSDKNELKREQEVADKVVLVDTLEDYKIKGYTEDIYYPAKMQKRNQFMVDNSDIVIAVWDGSKKGGTYNCIKYAQKLEKEIIQINPKDIG